MGSPEHRFGELTLSVGYIKETGNIEITIFQGRNLPGLDKSGTYTQQFVLGNVIHICGSPSGLSDPYVELALLPGFCFQTSSKKAKTPVQHKTLNPTFNYESVL